MPGLLVKGIFELWGQGATYDELERAIRQYPDEWKLLYLTPESSFKIVVDSFGKVISFEEQNEIIKGFTYIPFEVAATVLLLPCSCTINFRGRHLWMPIVPSFYDGCCVISLVLGPC